MYFSIIQLPLDAPYSKESFDWGYNLFAGNGSADLLGATDVIVADAKLNASDQYRPLVGSPVIDTGNPDIAYNDPDGSRSDIGAYGGPHADISTVTLHISTDPAFPSGTSPYTMTFAVTNVGSTDFNTVTVNAVISGQVSLSQTIPATSINGATISWSTVPISAGGTTSYTVQITPLTSEATLVTTNVTATWESGNNSSVQYAVINGDYIYLPAVWR